MMIWWLLMLNALRCTRAALRHGAMVSSQRIRGMRWICAVHIRVSRRNVSYRGNSTIQQARCLSASMKISHHVFECSAYVMSIPNNRVLRHKWMAVLCGLSVGIRHGCGMSKSMNCSVRMRRCVYGKHASTSRVRSWVTGDVGFWISSTDKDQMCPLLLRHGLIIVGERSSEDYRLVRLSGRLTQEIPRVA